METAWPPSTSEVGHCVGGPGSWVAELEEGKARPGEAKSTQHVRVGSSHVLTGRWVLVAGHGAGLSPGCRGRAHQVGSSLTELGWQELGAGRGLLVSGHP